MKTLGDIADTFGLEFRGDRSVTVSGVCALAPGKPGHLAFLANQKLSPRLLDSQAAVVIVPPGLAEQRDNVLISDNPNLTYARVAALFEPAPYYTAGVHPGALVDPDAVVEMGVVIGPNAIIEAGVRLGAGTYVAPAAVIQSGATIGADSQIGARAVIGAGVIIGERAQIHEGAVIGSRGFGNARDGARWVPVPQLGRVVIGDDVEIGANSTIDRGAIGDTQIGDGVKIDNLVQIGHNVKIGENTAIAGCSGVAGSAIIGARCMIGGGVGIVGHLEIVDDVMVMGGSRVYGDILESGAWGSGTPTLPVAQWRRQMAQVRRLGNMDKRIKALASKLKLLTDADND